MPNDRLECAALFQTVPRQCWETFTLSDVSLSSSFSTGTTRGFKGVTTSSAIIKFSLTSTKIKGVVGTI